MTTLRTPTANNPPYNIVIVGADLHAWTMALGLARANKGLGISITVIDDGTHNRSSWQEFSAHSFDFHRNLGLQEQALFKPGQVVFCQAIRFCSTNAEDIWLGNDTFLPVFQGIELHQVTQWLNESLEHYSLASCGAKAGKPLFPTQQTGTMANSFELSGWINTAHYQRFLQGAAKQLGVKTLQGQVQSVKQNPATGMLSALKIGSGLSVECDFVIDCSCHQSAVKETAANTIDDWSDTLDVAGFSETINVVNEPVQPYTSVSSVTKGMVRQITTGSNTISHHYWRKKAINSTMQPLPFFGKRHSLLTHNVLMAGQAGANIDGTCVPSLTITQRLTTRLLDNFPQREPGQYWQAEFNRLTNNDLDEVFQYWQLQHYLMASGDEDISPSHQSLHNTLALFAATGRLEIRNESLIKRQYWLNMLNALCQKRRGYDALLNTLTPAQGHQFIRRVQDSIQQSLAPSFGL